MALYESRNMLVDVPSRPHVDRRDGGHLVISFKSVVHDRRQLPPTHAVELIWMSSVVAEGMFDALPRLGVDLGRINYQDNGNWGAQHKDPEVHLHLYGRARSSRRQPYGQALLLPDPDDPYYDELQSFSEQEQRALGDAIEGAARLPRYADTEAWRLDATAVRR